MNLLALFLFFLGFVSAFSVSDIVAIPMVLSTMMLGKLALKFLKRGKIPKIAGKIAIPLTIFLMLLFISFISQIMVIGFKPTGLNHLISYAGTIMMYFVVPTLWMKAYKVPMEKVYKYISIGILFVAVFTLIEFVSKNFLGIPFDNYVYRPSVQRYNPTYNAAGLRLFRARGPAVESGHLAMYLSMFLPVVYFYYSEILKNKIKTVLSMSLIGAAIITTFSAIGLVEVVAALTIVVLFSLTKKIRKGLKFKEIMFITLSPLLLITGIIYGLNSPALQNIRNKVSLNAASGESRMSRWEGAIELFMDRPLFGNGPGITSIIYGTGSTSFYLEVLSQVGVIGISCLAFFFLCIFRMLLKIDGKIKMVYLFSFLVMVIHLVVISNYWYPWMWVLFSMVTYHSGLLKNLGEESRKLELVS